MQGFEFNRVPTEDDKRIAYQQGYIAMAKWLQELSGQTWDSNASITIVNKPNENYFKLNT